MHLNLRKILWIALLLEGSLAALFGVWSVLRGGDVVFLNSPWDFAFGAIAALPLLCVNLLLSRWQHGASGAEFERFRRKVIYPLAHALPPAAAFGVSILASFGEELFFRGVLQNEFGILISSLLFSLLHFGGAIRKFPRVSALYVIVSAYIGGIYAVTGSLSVVFTLHAVYDFAALMYLRYELRR
jgi:membrane protease YdiL (CAAX protease family)